MEYYLRRVIFTCIILLLIGLMFACDSKDDWFNFGDIGDEIERELSSVDGNWTGMSFDDIAISLQFTLIQNGEQVAGSGVYSDVNTPNPISITVKGTFFRPTLSLTFSGIIFENVGVTGKLTGDYETIGGISAPLSLSGQGISRQIDVLLQEEF